MIPQRSRDRLSRGSGTRRAGHATGTAAPPDLRHGERPYAAACRHATAGYGRRHPAQLHAVLTRYVILPSISRVGALWIAATHAQPAWAHAPRLVIRGPEKRCGKSRLLDIVEGTCHAPLITVNASPAAVYRAIGTDTPPTLLVDEADTIFGGKNADANEDLRGLLNAGHQRNRPAIRWDAATRSLETIPTFAMAALAGIGAMPDTIEDRAVVIRMRRRAPGETVAPFRHRRDRPALTTLAAAARPAGSRAHLAELESAEPAMPLEDRAADTWEPLIAVADLAGGDWPALARHAAVALTADRDQAASVSDRHPAAGRLPRRVRRRRRAADHNAAHPAAGRPRGAVGRPRPGRDHRACGSASCSASTTSGPPTSGSASRSARPRATTGPTSPTPGRGTAPRRRGEPSQPSQPSPPSSAPGRLDGWDGSTRPKDHDQNDQWDGSTRPTRSPVPGLTCDGTAGTAGTDTPRLRGIDGGAA